MATDIASEPFRNPPPGSSHNSLDIQRNQFKSIGILTHPMKSNPHSPPYRPQNNDYLFKWLRGEQCMIDMIHRQSCYFDVGRPRDKPSKHLKTNTNANCSTRNCSISRPITLSLLHAVSYFNLSLELYDLAYTNECAP